MLAEAAKRLGVAPCHVYRLIRSGVLEARQACKGAPWLIAAQALGSAAGRRRAGQPRTGARGRPKCSRAAAGRRRGPRPGRVPAADRPVRARPGRLDRAGETARATAAMAMPGSRQLDVAEFLEMAQSLHAAGDLQPVPGIPEPEQRTDPPTNLGAAGRACCRHQCSDLAESLVLGKGRRNPVLLIHALRMARGDGKCQVMTCVSTAGRAGRDPVRHSLPRLPCPPQRDRGRAAEMRAARGRPSQTPPLSHRWHLSMSPAPSVLSHCNRPQLRPRRCRNAEESRHRGPGRHAGTIPASCPGLSAPPHPSFAACLRALPRQFTPTTDLELFHSVSCGPVTGPGLPVAFVLAGLRTDFRGPR